MGVEISTLMPLVHTVTNQAVTQSTTAASYLIVPFPLVSCSADQLVTLGVQTMVFLHRRQSRGQQCILVAVELRLQSHTFDG